MKSIILTIAGIFICSIMFGQDTIYLIKGGIIKAKVIEIDESIVKYKNYNNMNGPIIDISKSDISLIKFENGTQMVINKPEENKAIKPVVKEEEKQEESVSERFPIHRHKRHYKNGIGLAGGFSSGFGLAYRYQPKNFGVQVNLFPYRDKYTSLFYPGIIFTYILRKGDDIDFLVYESNEYYYNRERSTDSNGSLVVSSTDDHFNNGIGIGIEAKLDRRVVLDLMGGYAQYRNFTHISITGEMGIFFKL